MALWLQGDRPNFPCATYWKDWRVPTFFFVFFFFSLSLCLPLSNLCSCFPTRHSFVSPWCSISRRVWFQLNWHLGGMLATWRERRTLSGDIYIRGARWLSPWQLDRKQEAGSVPLEWSREITPESSFPFHSIVIVTLLFPQAAYCRHATGFWTCMCRHMFDTWVYACRYSSHSQRSWSLCSWPLCGSSMSGVVGILGAGGWPS